MKKILYLSQVYPYPADGGGKIKTLNTLKALSEKYEVFAIFVSEKNPTKKEIEKLEKLGIKVKVFYSKKVLESVKDNLGNLASKFIRGIPHYVFQYTHKPAFPYIQNAIKSFKPDIIHVDHINMFQYLSGEKKEVWILEQHNLEHYLMWTRFIHTKKITRKTYLFIEATLTYLYERKVIKKFDHVFAISDEERERIKKTFKLENVSTQPLVYKALNYKKKISKNPQILFIGMITWPPNEDAVEWFLKKIFPLIQKEIPNVEFHAVGKVNKKLLGKMPKLANMVFHKQQPSLRKFFKSNQIFILPFKMGGGVRIKALTALANSSPIVSTSLGVEGLKIKHNKECLIASTPHTFAQESVKLLRSKKLRNKLSTNGLRYLESHHSEDQNKQFLKEYKKIINQ